MKKILSLFLSLILFTAQGNEYSLKERETISHVLYRFKFFPLYGEEGSVFKTLEINDLNLEKAKRLPIGYRFKLPFEKVEVIEADIVSKNEAIDASTDILKHRFVASLTQRDLSVRKGIDYTNAKMAASFMLSYQYLYPLAIGAITGGVDLEFIREVEAGSVQSVSVPAQFEFFVRYGFLNARSFLNPFVKASFSLLRNPDFIHPNDGIRRSKILWSEIGLEKSFLFSAVEVVVSGSYGLRAFGRDQYDGFGRAQEDLRGHRYEFNFDLIKNNYLLQLGWRLYSFSNYEKYNLQRLHLGLGYIF